MPAHPRTETLLWLAVGVIAFVAGWHFVTPYHSWGDDWAGYVLQARAIDSGSAAGEMELNGRLLRAGDRLLGPSAYPWGFPLLLWATGGATELSMGALKLVGAASLALTATATFTLARFFLPVLPALVAVSCVALQPILLLSVDDILSDLPFLAISTLALLVTLRQWRHGKAQHALRGDLTAAIVVLTLVGYSIRSNGVVIPLVYGFAVALLALDGAIKPGQAMRRLAMTAGCIIAAVLGYWAVSADGSLYALSYVSSSPAAVARQLRFFAEQSLLFAPFAGLPRPLQLAALGTCLLLVVKAVRGNRPGLIVAACAALHLLLLVSIDFVGYVRYLFPILPPMVVLVVTGALRLAQSARQAAPAQGTAAQGTAATAVCAALLACAVGMQAWSAQSEAERIVAEKREYGPLSASALAAFSAAAATAGPGGQVAFFKARAYRLLTGREAVVVSNPRRAGRVPCHLLYLGPERIAADRQLPETMLRETGFLERFRNAHFALLCRPRTDTRRLATSARAASREAALSDQTPMSH